LNIVEEYATVVDTCMLFLSVFVFLSSDAIDVELLLLDVPFFLFHLLQQYLLLNEHTMYDMKVIKNILRWTILILSCLVNCL